MGACVTATPRRTRSERRLHVETARVTVASARFVTPAAPTLAHHNARVHSRSTHRPLPPAMPIFLAAGKNAAECRRIVEGREVHVYEFQGADGVSPFADHAPEIKHHTVIGLKDPAGDDKWGDSELTALLYHAAAIKELLKANANVLVICRGGNNRSRTLAGIAERLLDLETGETVAEGRTLPADSELCKLVEVFDDRNAATRAGKITRYKAVGVTAEGRSKRKR